MGSEMCIRDSSNIDQSQFINHSVEAEILRKVLEKKLTQGQKIE